MKTLEVLPAQDVKVLKVIQIEGPDWNRFSGYVAYTREFNPKVYDNIAGDILDERILSTICHYYPNSSLKYNIEIFFKGQLEDNLRMLEGGTRKKITIQLTPDIPYELMSSLVNQTFHAYPLEFEMKLLFGAKSEKLEHINEFYLCSIPYEILDEKAKTIKPI